MATPDPFESTDLDPLSLDDLGIVRDVYLPVTVTADGAEVSDLSNAVAYTGDAHARRLVSGDDARMTSWVIGLVQAAGQFKESRYRLAYQGRYWRVHRERVVNHDLLVLRALPTETPMLTDLNIPNGLRLLLQDVDLGYGGLVLFAGANGQGKTTLASATVRSRLHQYGGCAITVEAPPELPLQGVHGSGVCYQIPVREGNMSSGDAFARALASTRRMFPAVTGGGTILFVGEILDRKTAAETLIAAGNGHLVLATMHGHSVAAVLTALVSLAYEELGQATASELLASVLRGVIWQRLTFKPDAVGWKRGVVHPQILWCSTRNTNASSMITNAIRDRVGDQIMNIVQQQTAVLHNRDPAEKYTTAAEVRRALSEAVRM